MYASLHRPENAGGEIRVVPEGGVVVVLTLAGDFDRHNAPELGAQLDQALESRMDLVIDLSEATFIDSSVINELFRVARLAKESEQAAVLQLGTAPHVERILEIVGIESVLPRAYSRREAIQRIERGRARVGEPGAAGG